MINKHVKAQKLPNILTTHGQRKTFLSFQIKVLLPIYQSLKIGYVGAYNLWLTPSKFVQLRIPMVKRMYYY